MACTLYLRVANDRTYNPSAAAAKQRLASLKKEARPKMATIQARLTVLGDLTIVEQIPEEREEKVIEFINDLEQLAADYGQVPEVGREIRVLLAKQHKRPTVQAVLHEGEAAPLWQEGQKLEKDGQICCAMVLYEDMLELLPAASARAAKQRLEALGKDPNNVAAAEICRKLQWCHEKYKTAERLAKLEPRKARDLFQKILERSPADSLIHRAAKDHLAQLD